MRCEKEQSHPPPRSPLWAIFWGRNRHGAAQIGSERGWVVRFWGVPAHFVTKPTNQGRCGGCAFPKLWTGSEPRIPSKKIWSKLNLTLPTAENGSDIFRPLSRYQILWAIFSDPIKIYRGGVGLIFLAEITNRDVIPDSPQKNRPPLAWRCPIQPLHSPQIFQNFT